MNASNDPLQRATNPDGPQGPSQEKADARASSGKRLRITLSTASVLPANIKTAFMMARDAGYDGVEVMPTLLDPLSWSVDYLEELKDQYGIPISSIHAPCLGVETAGVWGLGAWKKLDRAIEAARRLGARVVVVHPPLWYQFRYAKRFVKGIRERQERLDQEMPDGRKLLIAVENMWPRTLLKCRPHWHIERAPWATLDVSHAAAANVSILKLADTMGERLAHVHLSDSRMGEDGHLAPGRGNLPLDELIRHLVARGWSGDLCLEVNTLGRGSARQEDLEASASYVRQLVAFAK
ncbi:MAG TPA: sugar phosphate isomerase/epimerase family protein [Spirillospora sp.]